MMIFSYLVGACFALKIEEGSLFAHRAGGTTYAAVTPSS